MGRYAKGWTAAVGSAATVGLGMADQFCGTWVPAIAAFLTAVGVVMVPNARRSDQR